MSTDALEAAKQHSDKAHAAFGRKNYTAALWHLDEAAAVLSKAGLRNARIEALRVVMADKVRIARKPETLAELSEAVSIPPQSAA